MSNPLSTATATGVTTRYLTAMFGAVLTIVGLLGWLDTEQVEELRAMIPEFTGAIGVLVSGATMTYAILTKSSSDKAAEAAKQIDAKVPPDARVEIITPSGSPNIIVPAKP